MTDTMVSSRQAPWLTLGKLVDGVMTADEAARLGGLDFTVSLRRIQFNATVNPEADPVWETADHRRMVVRDDTNEAFDVVSADYGLLQYGEAFAFLNEIDRRFIAAGTLKGGKQGFMVVQLPELANLEALGFDDPHELYTIIRTSHDRTRAVECMVMPLRGRCMNELGIRGFAAHAQNRWSVHHVGDVAGKLQSAQEMVTNVTAYAADFVNTANRLYGTVLDNEDGDRILQRVLRAAPKRTDVIAKILDMWNTRESVGFVGTGWGLLNAVSEYFEWERGGIHTPQSQLLGVMEGPTRKAIDTTAALILSRHGG
jgi:phage/plasmid-like protein (TIGR03299 family)